MKKYIYLLYWKLVWYGGYTSSYCTHIGIRLGVCAGGRVTEMAKTENGI